MLDKYLRTSFTKKKKKLLFANKWCIRCSHCFRRVKSVSSIFFHGIVMWFSIFNLFLLLNSVFFSFSPFFSWRKHEWTFLQSFFFVNEKTTRPVYVDDVDDNRCNEGPLRGAYKTSETFVRERASYRSMIDNDDDKLLPVRPKMIKMKD